MSDNERERRLEEVYSAALQQDASRRPEFLRQACGGDTTLREEIESLLSDERKLGEFLEGPALEAANFSIACGEERSLVGQTLGPYDVSSLLGAGGMGEVYLARDTRLGRLVALKVLHPDVAADPERRRRLLLEAQAASALNDPHIVALYDLGSADGIDFLVMEYVPGKTLDKLIARGGLQIQQMLEYAVAVAEALATAHKAGVVHRDMKPGNIMITEEGAVKVLDFGLAKLTEASEAGAPSGPGSLVSMAGIILGTAAYMSPEQAQAQLVDARSDIFSFGVVLYEMLAGQRPFQGSDRMSTLAAVVRQEPKLLTELNAATPSELERVVLRCLRKDPNERFQNMADVRVALEGLQVAKAATRRFQIGIAAAILLALLSGLAAYQWTRRHLEPGAVRSLTERRLTANTPENCVRVSAVSPNGKYVAYDDQIGLFVRPIDSGEARPVRIPAGLLAWSATLHWFPNGAQLLADGPPNDPALWVIPTSGEVPPEIVYPRGQDPAISPDGRSIAFIDPSRQVLLVGGISRESPRKLAVRDKSGSLYHPAWSPDGQWIAYWNVEGWPQNVTIEVRSARGGPAKTLVPGSNLPTTTWLYSGSMIWSPDWRLVFALNEASDGIAMDVDNDGIWALRVEPTLCEASGKPERLVPRVGGFLRNLTITADGKRLAYVKGHSEFDVYVGDLERGGGRLTVPHRLTFDTRSSFFQGWTLDSQAILYESLRNGKREIFSHALTWTGTVPEVLVKSSESVCCPVLTPDGLWLLYWESVTSGRPVRRLMRRPAAGGLSEKVLDIAETPDADWVRFNCPEKPGYPCELSQREGQDLVFYSFDPVRGKGDRLGRFDTKGNGNFNWNPSLDGSRLGVVVRGEPRVAVLTLSDRAWHEIPVPMKWGTLDAIGTAADGTAFTVTTWNPDASDLLQVSAAGKVDLLLHKGWTEPALQRLLASPDGKHLAFKTYFQDTNVWMIENF